jgi:hypothetical protein
VPVDLTAIFEQLLSGNHGPDPADPAHRLTPNYGVVAALAGDVLEVELTFRSGSAYCCYEWGCHVALSNGKRWTGLRRLLGDHGIIAPPRMELLRTCIIEDGANFFDFGKPDPNRRGWYAFAAADALRFEAQTVEATSDDQTDAADAR